MSDKTISEILARYGESPRDATWKVQSATVIYHKALERIAPVRGEAGGLEAYAAPRTPAEEVLAGIFAEVLEAHPTLPVVLLHFRREIHEELDAQQRE